LHSRPGSQHEFKADTEYQSIQRYEHKASQAIIIKKDLQNSQTRKTVKVQDKPLVFAGRGYNISTFGRNSKSAFDLDYSTHLLPMHPEPMGSQLRGRINRENENFSNTKYLIYNSTRSVFGKLPPPLVESKPELSKKVENETTLERSPESVLLFPHGGESMLILRKAEKQIDLLAGNESLNRKKFKDSKALETRKKIPNTQQ
jgi:hypothetical protein